MVEEIVFLVLLVIVFLKIYSRKIVKAVCERKKCDVQAADVNSEA